METNNHTQNYKAQLYFCLAAVVIDEAAAPVHVHSTTQVSSLIISQIVYFANARTIRTRPSKAHNQVTAILVSEEPAQPVRAIDDATDNLESLWLGVLGQPGREGCNCPDC